MEIKTLSSNIEITVIVFLSLFSRVRKQKIAYDTILVLDMFVKYTFIPILL